MLFCPSTGPTLPHHLAFGHVSPLSLFPSFIDQTKHVLPSSCVLIKKCISIVALFFSTSDLSRSVKNNARFLAYFLLPCVPSFLPFALPSSLSITAAQNSLVSPLNLYFVQR